MRLYKATAKLIKTYAYETWSTTIEVDRKLAIVERKFLRKICGQKINNLTQIEIYEVRSNEGI